MRMLAMAAIVAIAGCAHEDKGRLVVPKTEAGMKCVRECALVYETCRSGRRVAGSIRPMSTWGDESCEDERYECAKTCPGAYERVAGSGYEDPYGGPAPRDR